MLIYDKNGYFLIKKLPKQILYIFIFSQLHCHDRMNIVMNELTFGGHLVQTTLDFKLMLQICEIYLFTYPTLTKSPAEIALPGYDSDNK